MQRRWSILLALLVLGILFASSTLTASAYAHATTANLYCDRFSASGTSDQPYVTLWVRNDDIHEQFFVIAPVVDGSFSATLSYPSQPTGSMFEAEIWGTPMLYTNLFDPGYWDGDEDVYFVEDVPCTPAPAGIACTYPLPDGSVVYSVPNGAQAYFNPDTQSSANFSLPAGTWKISEFKDDFAKVWISCEGTPIWIPKSAVGGAIG